jgi:GNAT superfamily N-acetyltransferase
VSRYGRIEPLARDHHLDGFDCGSEAQTTWLQRHALQAHRSDTAKVYVVCRSGSRDVVGYYALAAGSVVHEDVPDRTKRGTGRHPTPVVILTRLGVDLREQHQGLGSALLKDAFLQTASIADKVGVRALLIHAETADAAHFYRRIDSRFDVSPTDPLHLLLLLKDLRLSIEDAAGYR